MRVVTLNLWGERGPLAERWPLVEEGLAALAPDVVALQEVRVLPGRLANQAETLAGRLGMSAVFAPAMEWGGGVEGVAILSRRPAEDPWIEELPGASTALRRVALAVRVEDAGGPVRIATSHLHYRLEDGAIREAQTVALDALLARRQEPAAILLGDLNAVPDADEIRFLRGRTTIAGRRTYWQDAWELWHAGEIGHTWARENHFTDALHFLQPGRRIDYVLVSPEQPDGRCRVDGAFVAMDRADARGHFPSDHYAVVADVRIGPSA